MMKFQYYFTCAFQRFARKGRHLILVALLALLALADGHGQRSIYSLMDTTGLTLNEIDQLANQYFAIRGKGRGTGFKQYQRWLYEKQFHVDEQGYLIPRNVENAAYKLFRKSNPDPVRRSAPWTELGPDYWSPTSGWNPGNGRLTSIAVHPTNSSILYVGSPGGGIWKTTNGGASWLPLIDHENADWMDVFHIAIDPGNPAKLYAGLTEGGVIRSTNAGADWTTTGFGPELVRKIIVHPTNTSIVLVASITGIHRSTNGGNTWSLVSTIPAEDLEFKPGDPNIVYASTDGAPAFLRSTNNGATWTPIGSSSGITHTGRTLIGVSPDNPNIVYVVQSAGDEFGRMYKSTNSGSTFSTTVIGNPGTGTNYFGYESSGTGTGGQAYYDMAICVNPGNANEVYIGGINCWKSVNGGVSFSPMTEWFYPNSLGYVHADIHALEYVGFTLFAGTDGGVFRSTNDGFDWTDISQGLGIRQIYRLACAEQNAQIMMIGSQDNGTSIRRSNGTWIDWLGADGMDGVISPFNSQVMYGMIQYGGLYKTTDGGQTEIDMPEPGEGKWVTPLVMDPVNEDILYGGWNGIYKSTNGGSSWTLVSGGMTEDLDVLAISPTNGNFLYASVGSTLYRSSNAGGSWTSVNAGAMITDIYVSENNPQKIWVTFNTTSSQVKVSENMGTTFTTISNGLPALSARCIAVDEQSANGIYVGMNIGVYHRDDNNQAWSEFESGLPLVAIRDIELVKSAGLVRVATYGRGVWETEMLGPAPVECPESCCSAFIQGYSDCRDFENYTNGNIYPQGSPPFNLFSGNQNEQATVSTLQAYSGTKSLRFNTSTSDITYDIFRTITRVARLEWMTYIPAGRAGEFGFYTDNSQVYPLFVRYNSGMATMYRETGPNESQVLGTFSYAQNSWFKSVLIFFPDDRIEFWQNGVLRHTVTNDQSNQIGHLNFYYNDAGITDFFVDDICYSEHFNGFVSCSEVFDPVCVNGFEFFNSCYAQDAGYSECEWTYGPCEAVGCDPCGECFFYLPRYLTATTVDFQNQYCGEPWVGFEGSGGARSVTYQWSVQNATVQYTSGTSATSENPSMIFPGPGSYTVCQKVFSFGTLVFECCLTVVIGGCASPPDAFYTSQFFSFNSVFKLTANAGSNAIRWTFSDPDVTFWSGNEYSSSPEIQIPSGRCVTVCLYETNACGTSMYCSELCLDHPSCSGTTPPLFITAPVTPYVEDKTVEFDLPNAPAGATYQWDFGDGSVSTDQDVVHAYPEYGHYTVCVVVTAGCRTWCYCWTIVLDPCGGEQIFNDGLLTFEFVGSDNDLRYVFTSSEPKAPGESWLVNDVPVAGSSSTLTYTFPAAGNYVICYPYVGEDGCVYYTCIDVAVGNPFACTAITWVYDASNGYRFSIPSGASEIRWTIDETGQQIGQAAASNWVLPVAPCGWRTISVRYFDGVRYRVCCLRIYLCAPDDCAGSIDYGYLSSTNQSTFTLNAAGATDINWYYDDQPGQSLGSTAAISVPYPVNCQSRWISVRYKDATGRWRVCCRLVYLCNPLDCDLIRIHYSPGAGYFFSVSEAQESMSWVLEETGTQLGTSTQTGIVQFGANCGYRTISLRYWVPGLGWRLCCLRFYWCDPADCNDKITFGEANGKLVLHAEDHVQDVNWFRNGVLLGTQQVQPTDLSASASHEICIRYFDPCDQAWYWCCRTYTPGGSESPLTFALDDHVCGDLQQVVDIPLRVKGFSNIQNFQFTVEIADPSKGELVGILRKDLPGDFASNIINSARGGVSWDNATAVDLPDRTEIATVRVRILSGVTGETAVRIVNSPVSIYVEDGAGNERIPIIEEGSFCYVKYVSICGRITREDLVPIGNVTVTLEGCKRWTTVTGADGRYCFDQVPAGSTYRVRASKDTNYKNGVNSGDLSAIRRHILTMEPLSTPYRILAADGKLDGRVNSGDVSELRRLILGIIDDLPTCESWMFTDKAFVFQQPGDPFSSGWREGATVTNVQDNVAALDLIGWKMGDVSLGNNPQFDDSLELAYRHLKDIFLIASSKHLPDTQDFEIAVSTRGFDQVRAGQFSMQWDPALFRLNDVGAFHPQLGLGSDNFFLDAGAGRLGFLWDDAAPVTLQDDDVLFKLQFTALVSPTPLSEIMFGEVPVTYYFEDGNGEELNVVATAGEVTVPIKEVDRFPWTVYPNPSNGWIQLQGSYGLVDRLYVYDGHGRLVFSGHDVRTGERIELGETAAGMYTLKALKGDAVFIHRIVVLPR